MVQCIFVTGGTLYLDAEVLQYIPRAQVIQSTWGIGGTVKPVLRLYWYMEAQARC